MSHLLNDGSDDDILVQSNDEGSHRGEEEPEPYVKCGEIRFLKDIRQITFNCAVCGKETQFLDKFLRHALQHHLDLDDNEVDALVRNSTNTTFDELDDMEVDCKTEEFGEIEIFDDFSPTATKDAGSKFIKNFEKFLDKSNVSLKTEMQEEHSICSDEGAVEYLLDEESEKPDTVGGFQIEFVGIAEGTRRYRDEENLKTPRPKKAATNERNVEAKRSTRDTTLISCEICDTSFNSHAQLKKHSKLHAKKRSRSDKRFLCDLCDAKFADSSNLKVHRYRHLGYKPHKCELCDKAFTSSTELKLHMRSHTGERPFVCSECGKCFTSSAHLTSHRRRHSNLRPSVCPTCGKSFYDNKLLRDHMVAHSQERPFECEQCHMKFSRRKALTEHVKLHSGVKRYCCKICPKAFAQNAGLHSHMKQHLALK